MVSRTVERFGGVDILVNNAGIALRKMPQEYTAEEWDQVLDINLKGTFLCSREVYGHMARAGAGKVINIGSMTSIFGLALAAPYGASKGGVVQLTKALAVAWAEDNIQVNSGPAGLDHNRPDSQYQVGLPGAVQADLVAHTPRALGRAGRPCGSRRFPGQPRVRLRHGCGAAGVDGGYTSF